MEKVERCFCKKLQKRNKNCMGTTSRTTYIKEIPFDFQKQLPYVRMWA